MLTAALAKALESGFVKLSELLLAAVVKKSADQLKIVFQQGFSDLQPHIQSNFDRCSKVKTILNRSAPVEMLSLYVNIRLSNGKNIIDDFEFIESIGKIKKIIISGTGGGGKTIFMKYLWLSLFAGASGRIPVFIELRKLNDAPAGQLLSYIYRSIIGTGSVLSEEQFRRALQQGTFALIFDGYDEINNDRREAVGTEIRQIAQDHKDLVIIVSGRPDERLESWQAFSVFNVLPFTKKQTIDLLKKLEYDRAIKNKFIQRVRKDLYLTHRSFLSNPLLATMMLLTFDQFAEIPEKAFLFYDQAFDTLFLKHDATKEGYQRKKYTKFSIDEFKKILSFMCLTSYVDEKFSFSQSEINEYSRRAHRMAGHSVSKDKFVKDLIESVCLLQINGTNIEFTHRSFQEYFTAYCLVHCIDEQFASVLDKVVQRKADVVVRMIFEMRKDKLESEYILPRSRELIDRIEKFGGITNISEFFDFFRVDLQIAGTKKRPEIVLMDTSVDFDFMERVIPLYIKKEARGSATRLERMRALRAKDDAALKSLQSIKSAQDNELNIIVGDITACDTIFAEDICNSGFAEYCLEMVSKLREINAEVNRRTRKSNKTIEKLLNIKN